MNFYNKLTRFIDKLKKRNGKSDEQYIKTKKSVDNLSVNIKNLEDNVNDYINTYKSYMDLYNKK
jgi:hypothetical protein